MYNNAVLCLLVQSGSGVNGTLSSMTQFCKLYHSRYMTGWKVRIFTSSENGTGADFEEFCLSWTFHKA